jgi:hypothetical protein
MLTYDNPHIDLIPDTNENIGGMGHVSILLLRAWCCRRRNLLLAGCIWH